ncbi:hypothetical protein D3C81_1925810 [compost metagenome]
MLERCDGQFRFSLCTVVGVQPHQVSTPSMITTDSYNRSAVKGLTGCQVVSATPVKIVTEVYVAEIQRITLDQKSVANDNLLSTC